MKYSEALKKLADEATKELKDLPKTSENSNEWAKLAILAVMLDHCYDVIKRAEGTK